jgi:UDP-N-acetylglucosamine:LPS N-acetylglucosamine transferase
LCGRNEQLRRAVEVRLPGCRALGWRDDLPDLFAASAVLVDQSGGNTCAEAFATGLPVVLHAPLPGHGRLGARALAAGGVAWWAKDSDELLVAVDRLARPGVARDRQIEKAAAVFVRDPVDMLLGWRAATYPDLDRVRRPVTREGEPLELAHPRPRWASGLGSAVSRREVGPLTGD